MINTKLAKLYYYLVTQSSDIFVKEPTTLTIVADQEWVQLPADFFQANYVFGMDGDRRVELQRMDLGEMAKYNGDFAFDWRPSSDYFYRVVGRKLYLVPEDIQLDSIQLWYTATAPVLSIGADTLPFDLPPNWDECIINGVTGLVKLKDEADARPYFQLEEQCYAELALYSADRDVSRPNRVVDVRERR
jgi:hypothetical protein